MNDATQKRHDVGDENDDLQRRIVSYLEQRHYPAIRDLKISTHNGAVTLQGKLNSFYEKQICISTCQRVAGVLRIIDEMEVATAFGSARNSSPDGD